MKKQKITLYQDDVAHLLTAMADTLNGYPLRELADDWREAAARLATALRFEGIDDEGTWDEFTGPDEPEDDAYDDNGSLRAGEN